jgi:hypothetical protein
MLLVLHLPLVKVMLVVLELTLVVSTGLLGVEEELANLV